MSVIHCPHCDENVDSDFVEIHEVSQYQEPICNKCFLTPEFEGQE